MVNNQFISIWLLLYFFLFHLPLYLHKVPLFQLRFTLCVYEALCVWASGICNSCGIKLVWMIHTWSLCNLFPPRPTPNLTPGVQSCVRLTCASKEATGGSCHVVDAFCVRTWRRKQDYAIDIFGQTLNRLVTNADTMKNVWIMPHTHSMHLLMNTCLLLTVWMLHDKNKTTYFSFIDPQVMEASQHRASKIQMGAWTLLYFKTKARKTCDLSSWQLVNTAEKQGHHFNEIIVILLCIHLSDGCLNNKCNVVSSPSTLKRKFEKWV